jgi:hypothetical protein
MIYISDHVSYNEVCRSYTAIRHGIDNAPPQLVLPTIKETARNIFEPVREHFKVRIYISSFYRAPALNVKIGGSATSSHPMGEALDMDADYYQEKLLSGEVLTNAMIFNWIRENLSFDQLIWEFGDDENCNWVHAGWRGKSNNRKQVLRSVRHFNDLKNKHETIYLPYPN